MGGEKFDTPQPEAYLFGENMDLNFFSKCPSTVSIFNLLYNYIYSYSGWSEFEIILKSGEYPTLTVLKKKWIPATLIYQSAILQN